MASPLGELLLSAAQRELPARGRRGGRAAPAVAAGRGSGAFLCHAVVARAAPGNARDVRGIVAAGFVPPGAEVLRVPHGGRG
ncbi:hypothetical protein [Streptomyces sp. NRRL S-1813]|uniref:hypothetical protein n=1 Tax=Streptomyces sp. NRRL S-1813 TaxID=1463888 RepID=UPI001F2E5FD2|nr:hypothetical protein [Streptomyces sp. NRRL S-1813]